MSIFESASRQKLRFNSAIGQLTIEDLWDLPLVRKTRNGTSLDEIAQAINAERESVPTESFVSPVESTTTKTLDLQLEILKHIIGVKLEELSAAEKAAETRSRKQKLLAALARKEDAALENMSADEIRAALAEM